MFPGAVKSAFSYTMRFEQPSTYPALPTYRVVDQNGAVVDPDFVPDLSDEEVVKLYRDMLTVSIMDLIMFDAQRQGRLSFYMVSAGEEAVSVGTASALAKEDVVFCQYREQGVFKQRGFTLNDFMNQLFANQKDPGKGRNMPVHYGSRELNIVRRLLPKEKHDNVCVVADSVVASTLFPPRSRPSFRRLRGLLMRSRSRGCRTRAYLRGW
jgi:2-oxoisovalerate dehydrogenase E1 component alpha subunit